jgi:hypothetical protein
MSASQNSRMTCRHIPQGEIGALTSLVVPIEMTGKRIERSVRDGVIKYGKKKGLRYNCKSSKRFNTFALQWYETFSHNETGAM